MISSEFFQMEHPLGIYMCSQTEEVKLQSAESLKINLHHSNQTVFQYTLNRFKTSHPLPIHNTQNTSFSKT